jgi:hypothetical protein
MTFFGDFYSKAGPINQGFELSLPFRMHSAEMYDQNSKHHSKIKVTRGLGYCLESPGQMGI